MYELARGTHDFCRYNDARSDVDLNSCCPRAAEAEQHAATKEQNAPAESPHVEWRQVIAIAIATATGEQTECCSRQALEQDHSVQVEGGRGCGRHERV